MHGAGIEARVSYLTTCTYQLDLESQLPHKIVNLIFTIINQNMKLTVLWETALSKTNQEIHCVK